MNHLKARQLEATGKWHYTLMNDERIYPIGRCREHEGHDTPEEAKACYKSYLLDTKLRFDSKLADTLQHCEVCGEWTDGLATIPTTTWQAALCDAHRIREEVEKLFYVGESWES